MSLENYIMWGVRDRVPYSGIFEVNKSEFKQEIKDYVLLHIPEKFNQNVFDIKFEYWFTISNGIDKK